MEEVARHNLNELCDRSLVQMGEKWGRNILTCRLHDLLRDLAIKKAREQCFSSNCDTDKDFPKSSIASKCRRYAIYSESEMGLWLPKYCNEALPTLFFFCSARVKTENEFLLHICKKFTSLKVLDLEGLFFEKTSLPTEIGKLIHLKYLGLSNTFINTLPSSIVNFRRLQTLVISCDWSPISVELPTEISELEESRHLIEYFKGPLLLNNLTNLQTLRSIKYYWWMKLEHRKFVNLRDLWICGANYKSNIKSYSLESLGKLKRIQSLYLEFPSNYVPCLQPLANCPDLIELRLLGKVEKLPEDLHSVLPNFECLYLDQSEFENDPMPILENLPNLMYLTLIDAYCVEKIVCRAKGFSRLEVLTLYLRSLEEWEVEDEGMPYLQKLEIWWSSKFNIPIRL